ncbi:hypothetical protein Bbelb_316110 [Branchiostoma belcheri]|nr:hypothetical protein Bbelb_316110 [Branchiostoma belcheri]
MEQIQESTAGVAGSASRRANNNSPLARVSSWPPNFTGPTGPHSTGKGTLQGLASCDPRCLVEANRGDRHALPPHCLREARRTRYRSGDRCMQSRRSAGAAAQDQRSSPFGAVVAISDRPNFSSEYPRHVRDFPEFFECVKSHFLKITSRPKTGQNLARWIEVAVRFRVDLVRHPFTPTRCLVPAGGPLCHSRGAGRIGLLSPRLASTRHRGSLEKYDPRCLVEASRGDRHHCRRIAYGRPGARYRAGDQCMHDDLQGPQRRIDDPVSSAVFSAVDRTILSIATGFGRFEAIAK